MAGLERTQELVKFYYRKNIHEIQQKGTNTTYKQKVLILISSPSGRKSSQLAQNTDKNPNTKYKHKLQTQNKNTKYKQKYKHKVQIQNTNVNIQVSLALWQRKQSAGVKLCSVVLKLQQTTLINTYEFNRHVYTDST